MSATMNDSKHQQQSGGGTLEHENEARPIVSVIVPIRNEEDFIADTLEQLLSQDYDPERYEIIVVDGMSTDRTWEVVEDFTRRYPQVRLLRNPRKWSSSARNLGVSVSRGEIILVVDAHCQLETESYLEELVHAFQTSQADCIGRPQPLDVARASALQRAIAAARSSRLGHHPASFIYSSAEGFVPAHSVGVAYRRNVFRQIGYFDETFDACEDVDFNHRLDQAGLRCFLTPRLAVHYHPRPTIGGLYRQLFRYGRGRGRLLRKHPETFSLGSMVPAAFVAGLIVGLPLAIWSPLLRTVYLTVIGIYLFLVLLASSRALWQNRSSLSMAPWLPLVFFAIHGGAGAGVLYELVFGPPRQRVRECAASESGEHLFSASVAETVNH
jgi:succinoglycan biosynthesis protein ExoA